MTGIDDQHSKNHARARGYVGPAMILALEVMPAAHRRYDPQ